MKKLDVYYSVILVALGVFLFLFSSTYKTNDTLMPYGPDAFPRMLGLGLIICGILLFAVSIKYFKEKIPSGTFKIVRLLVIVCALTIYIASMQVIGFLIGSIVLFAFCMWWLQCKNKLVIALCSTIIPSVIFVLFYYVFHIAFPLGLLAGIL